MHIVELNSITRKQWGKLVTLLNNRRFLCSVFSMSFCIFLLFEKKSGFVVPLKMAVFVVLVNKSSSNKSNRNYNNLYLR